MPSTSSSTSSSSSFTTARPPASDQTLSLVDKAKIEYENAKSMKTQDQQCQRQFFGTVKLDFIRDDCEIENIPGTRMKVPSGATMRDPYDSHILALLSNYPEDVQEHYCSWANKKVTMMKDCLSKKTLTFNHYLEQSQKFYNSFFQAHAIMTNEYESRLTVHGGVYANQVKQVAANARARNRLSMLNMQNQYKKYFYSFLNESRKVNGFQQAEPKPAPSIDDLLEFIGTNDTGQAKKAVKPPRKESHHSQSKKNHRKKKKTRNTKPSPPTAQAGPKQHTTEHQAPSDSHRADSATITESISRSSTVDSASTDSDLEKCSIHKRVARWKNANIEDVKAFEDRKDGEIIRQYESKDDQQVTKMRLYHYLPDLHKVLANDQIRECFTNRQDDENGGYTLMMLVKFNHEKNDKNPAFGCIKMAFSRNSTDGALTLYHSMFNTLPDGCKSIQELAKHNPETLDQSDIQTPLTGKQDGEEAWYTAASLATYEPEAGLDPADSNTIRVSFEKAPSATSDRARVSHEKEAHSLVLFRLH